MNYRRPKNLDLFSIRFPLPAIASIMHRVSGAVLFLIIPVFLWVLGLSLTDAGFDWLQQWYQYSVVKLLCMIALLPFCYHLVAGIRHLLSDLHIGNTKTSGRRAVIIVFIVSVLLVFLLGIRLW